MNDDHPVPPERPVLITRVPPGAAAVEMELDYGVLFDKLRENAIRNGGSAIFDEHGNVRPEHRPPGPD